MLLRVDVAFPEAKVGYNIKEERDFLSIQNRLQHRIVTKWILRSLRVKRLRAQQLVIRR